jgi:hypothetical protein
MSIARVYTTKGPVRKDGLRCGKCGCDIVKGVDRRRTFAVGFRGWEQTRCMKSECTPTRSELESSALSSVYATIDGLDLDGAETLADLEALRDEVVDSLNEIADEYDSNEMIEINEMLQERRDMLQDAASELENWEPENEEPEQDEDSDDDDEDDETQSHEEWLDEARESLREAIDNLELP